MLVGCGRWDHPRLCGEKQGCRLPRPKNRGSPPPVRGKDRAQRATAVIQRITPACAGKRFDRAWCPCPGWDHPRLCGEKAVPGATRDFAVGSPPPVRGKAVSTPSMRRAVRITPACAGKRAARSWTRCARRDHPRLCGEKSSSFCQNLTPPGSPPPVRGKVSHCRIWDLLPRITPACAGKRQNHGKLALKDEDHPRLCGEKITAPAKRSLQTGSPPPVRGKAHGVLHLLEALGITPACAGKSTSGSSSRSTTKDHPRLCGEKCTPSRAAEMPLGSPPPVRGKALSVCECARKIRITPACAGKRLRKSRNSAILPSHVTRFH